jgi:retron-type reverse transcriptase
MLDISMDFDALDHTLLIKKISESSLHPNIVRWLSGYISGRKAWCVYGSAQFKQRTPRSGVPQGLVLSPALFNHFGSDCPYPISKDGILTSYADGFLFLETDSDLAALE